jgi:hypothetical protein
LRFTLATLDEDAVNPKPFTPSLSATASLVFHDTFPLWAMNGLPADATWSMENVDNSVNISFAVSGAEYVSFMDPCTRTHRMHMYNWPWPKGFA